MPATSYPGVKSTVDIAVNSGEDEGDFWESEEFEESLTRGLLAFFETKVKKNKGAYPDDRLKPADLEQIRRFGLYCPGKARVVLTEGFDTKNDPFPSRGAVLFPWEQRKPEYWQGYCTIVCIERIPFFPRGVCHLGPGKCYRIIGMVPHENGRVQGERRYFSISDTGEVCAGERVFDFIRYGWATRKIRHFDEEPQLRSHIEWHASVAAQFLADERFVWRIEATERHARVRLGCEREEVKSLLYARELPRTATGRKRPILHLVEAHRRRVRSGVDINIDEFLRGTREVVMDGTKFVVHPPQSLLVTLKNQSWLENEAKHG